MEDNKKEVAPAEVSPIDWKSSFSSHPFLTIYTKTPIVYRIVCESLSDDGETLTIIPCLNFSIDDMLNVLEGCLKSGSNFRAELKEYYGDKVQNLNTIKCAFNGIWAVITDQITAWESKLNWLRDGLRAGYKSQVIHLTIEERTALESDDAMKDLIHKYRKELLYREELL